MAHVVSRGAEERVDLEEALDDILQRHEGKRGDRWKEDKRHVDKCKFDQVLESRSKQQKENARLMFGKREKGWKGDCEGEKEGASEPAYLPFLLERCLHTLFPRVQTLPVT